MYLLVFQCNHLLRIQIATSYHSHWTCRSSQLSTRTIGNEVQLDLLDDENKGTAVISLNRPAAKNALGRVMLKEFREALAAVQSAKDVRAVVLRSTVPKVFCAGADLKERAGMSQAEVGVFVSGLRSAFADVGELPMPTIAAIEGAALGGGLELALACDFRIAGADALLGLTETGLAIIPGAGGTQRLPRLIGATKAKELIFTARRLRAKEALEYGILNYVTPADHALERSLALAREILPNGPVAVRMAKAAIDGGMQVDLKAGLAVEQRCYAGIIDTEDRTEGLTAFREKRKPVYKGK